MPDDLLAPPKPPFPFIGREAEISRLEKEIDDGYTGRGRPIIVTGRGGIGKTALVAMVMYRLAGISIETIGEIKPGKSQFINSRFGEDRMPQPIWLSARFLPDALKQFHELMRPRDFDRSPRPAIVVLDGADETSKEEFNQAIRTVLNFKRVQRLIITTRDDVNLRGERTVSLEPLEPGDAQLLLTDLSGKVIAPEPLEQMLRLVDGHPYFITQLAQMAKSMGPEELKQVLAGHLYDINDATSLQAASIIETAKPIIISANEAMVQALKKQPKDIFALTSRQFEELVAELMHDQGYEVTLTKATRDGGKDILASIKTPALDMLVLVEAKRYKAERKIGVELVRSLYGTLCDYRATSAMLVTTSSFSKDARALQQKHQFQMSLRDYADVAEWIQGYGRNKR